MTDIDDYSFLEGDDAVVEDNVPLSSDNLSQIERIENYYKIIPEKQKIYLEKSDPISDELELTSSEKLLRKYMEFAGIGNYHIEIFNIWIDQIIHIDVAAYTLTYSNGDYLNFENFILDTPSYYSGTTRFDLTPKYAREKGLTYDSVYYADLVLFRNEINKEGKVEARELKRHKQMVLFKVPIMLKSSKCILRDKSPAELAAYGEDPKDPGGYFIIEGVEKIVQGQEQLTLDKILMMKLKDSVSVRLVSNMISGTSLIQLILDDATKNIILIKLPSLRGNIGEKQGDTINALRIFRLLSSLERSRLEAEGYEPEDLIDLPLFDNINDIKNFIARFIKTETPGSPKYKSKSLLKLTRTLVDFSIITDDRTIISSKMNKSTTTPNTEITDDQIIDLFEKDFFPQMNDLQGPNDETPKDRSIRIVLAKLNLLAIMIARFLEYLAGFRNLDDRDSWSNKRVEGAARMMETLFRKIWRKPVFTAKAKVLDNAGFETVANSFNSYAEINSTFRDSFITGNWGVKGTPLKNNVAKTLARESKIATFADVGIVDVAISRTDTQQQPRLVQESQWGLVSPLDSPEGENCGILKNVTLTAKMSIGRYDKPIIRLLIGDIDLGIKPMVFTNYVEQISMFPNNEIPNEIINSRNKKDIVEIPGVSKVMVGSKFIGWCMGDYVREQFIDFRRKGKIQYDISIIKDNDWLYIELSPSRLVRPVLIVDPESQPVLNIDPKSREVTLQYIGSDNFLLLDKLGLRNGSNYELLSNGVLEFLSSWEQEQEDIKIATSEAKIKERAELIIESYQKFIDANDLLESVQKLNNKLFSKIDINEVKEIINNLFKGVNIGKTIDRLYLTKEVINELFREIDIDENRLITAEDAINKLFRGMNIGENRLKIAEEVINKLFNKIDINEANDRLKSATEVIIKLLKNRPYSHCEIDGTIMMGIAGALIPWPNHNQAPRNTYQVAMGKQALGEFHSNHLNRMTDGKTKTLVFHNRPMVETNMYNVIGIDKKGQGENVTLAFMAIPYTEEDAFVFKKEFLDNGGMRMYKYITYKTIVEANEELTLPDDSLLGINKSHYKYIQDNGFPKIGAPLFAGDCIIGKVRKLTPTKDKKLDKIIRNESICLRIGDEGVVEKISTYSNGAKTTVIVKIRIMRIPEAGDKFAPRNAQKGTVGLVMSEIDLPFGKSGTSPDIITNSASMPSRMTLSYPMESHSAKAGAMKGRHINGTAFHEYKRDQQREDLKQYGMHEFAYEEMRSGTSGKPLAALIYCGPIYFQALKHHVKDKIQARGTTGQVKPDTRQPTKGKANRGGLRFGGQLTPM